MTNLISTRVSVSEAALDVCIHDVRPDTVQTVAGMNSAQQDQLAYEAWLIGYRAVTNAHRLAEEARLNDIGKSLLEDIDVQLRGHAERQAERMQTALSNYFDPESGHVGERLRQLVGDGGALPALLERHLGPQNSILVETLVKHVGEQSPLFKKLSPTDSEGLLQLMGERLRKVMEEQNQAFHKALDPRAEGGAIAGFILSLRDELKRAEDDQAAQLKLALAALDTTKPDSLLNQLRRDTQQAREQLLQAINPAADGSPLAVIHSSLLDRLERHAKSQQEQLDEARQLATDFQRDVREAVQRIELRRREELRSSRGGRLFEDAVLDFVQQAVGGNGYRVENTGSTVGRLPSCKIGDGVICFPEEHLFRDARVVIEAKHDKRYTVAAALEELRKARENRDACAGIFVMAKSHAAPGFPTFCRYGQDVLVVWDPEASETDPYLNGALMVGLGLAARQRKTASDGDLKALQKIEQRITRELERLGTIRDAAAKIRKQVETIDEEASTGSRNLQKLVGDAQQTLLALKVELHDEALEAGAPIALCPPANDEAGSPDGLAVSGA
jgi:hypothetical protein